MNNIMNTHQTLSSLSMAVSADLSPGARSFGPSQQNYINIEENFREVRLGGG